MQGRGRGSAVVFRQGRVARLGLGVGVGEGITLFHFSCVLPAAKAAATRAVMKRTPCMLG